MTGVEETILRFTDGTLKPREMESKSKVAHIKTAALLIHGPVLSAVHTRLCIYATKAHERGLYTHIESNAIHLKVVHT